MDASIKSFVVDASFVLSSLLPDEKSPETDKVLRKYVAGDVNLFSTRVFELEVYNGIRSAILQRRITRENALIISEQFHKLGISCEDVDSHEAFLVAIKENLSVYDASYLWLAISKNLPLLTLDNKLIRIIRKNEKNKQ